MDNPLVFLVIIGVVLFIFMSYSGSSFLSISSGPIATGPGVGSGIENPSTGEKNVPNFSTSPTPVTTIKKSDTVISPYHGTVKISSVSISREGPSKESLVLRQGGFFSFGGTRGGAINIDGWVLENNDGVHHPIPGAFNIPYVDSGPSPINLTDGGEIIIVSGDHNFGSSLRENICTGYLEEFYDFQPSLTFSCPSYSVDDLFKRGLNSACIDVVRNAPRCQQVSIGPTEIAAGDDCVAFSREHLNYYGCVKDNQFKNGFFSNRWRVFMKSKETLWNKSHDRIILRDKNGFVVDEYIY